MAQNHKRKLPEEDKIFVEFFKKAKWTKEEGDLIRQFIDRTISEKTPEFPFESVFAEEILEKLFNYVDDWRIISLVCKRWRNVSKNLKTESSPPFNLRKVVLWTLLRYLKSKLISSFDFDCFSAKGKAFLVVGVEEEKLRVRLSFGDNSKALEEDFETILTYYGWTKKAVSVQNKRSTQKKTPTPKPRVTSEWETDYLGFLFAVPFFASFRESNDGNAITMLNAVPFELYQEKQLELPMGHSFRQVIGKTSRPVTPANVHRFKEQDIADLFLFVRSFWKDQVLTNDWAPKKQILFREQLFPERVKGFFSPKGNYPRDSLVGRRLEKHFFGLQRLEKVRENDASRNVSLFFTRKDCNMVSFGHPE